MNNIDDQYMLKEYETLRSEILNTYGEQTRLVFAMAITLTVLVFAKLYVVIPKGFFLPVLLSIVIGIGLKSLANYHRIFRIGGYLAVVHEQSRQHTRCPSPIKAAWHCSWRNVKESREDLSWVGQEGPRAEAVFIGLVASLGWALALYKGDKDAFCILEYQLAFVISVIMTFVLLDVLRRLCGVLKRSGIYRDAFTEEFRDFIEGNHENEDV